MFEKLEEDDTSQFCNLRINFGLFKLASVRGRRHRESAKRRFRTWANKHRLSTVVQQSIKARHFRRGVLLMDRWLEVQCWHELQRSTYRALMLWARQTVTCRHADQVGEMLNYTNQVLGWCQSYEAATRNVTVRVGCKILDLCFRRGCKNAVGKAWEHWMASVLRDRWEQRRKAINQTGRATLLAAIFNPRKMLLRSFLLWTASTRAGESLQRTSHLAFQALKNQKLIRSWRLWTNLTFNSRIREFGIRYKLNRLRFIRSRVAKEDLRSSFNIFRNGAARRGTSLQQILRLYGASNDLHESQVGEHLMH